MSSCHPLATLAGVETLKAGGTAADAAVATNAVLAVTQSNNCGLGGDLFCLYYEAATRRVHFLNGAGRAGSRATLAEVARRGMKGLPVIGPATVSVPGVTRAWAMLLERFGSRPLDRLLAPAIHYAERGFPITSILSQGIAEYAPGNPDPEWRRVFFAGGRAPAPGEMFVQPDLARTLRDLASEGPDLFYRGRVAQVIAERMAADGFLTPDDLAAHRGEWGEPIATTYRGFTVYETPPPTQGITALMALNMLEGVPLAKLPLHSARASASAAGDHQARLRRPGSLDRRSGPGARAGRGAARQRRTPPRDSSSSIPARRASTVPGTPTATPPASSSPTDRATSSA